MKCYCIHRNGSGFSDLLEHKAEILDQSRRLFGNRYLLTKFCEGSICRHRPIISTIISPISVGSSRRWPGNVTRTVVDDKLAPLIHTLDLIMHKLRLDSCKTMRRFVYLLRCPKGRFLSLCRAREGRAAWAWRWRCRPAALRPCSSWAKVRHGLIWWKRRIHVLNHRISAKRELSATLLLPNFQVHRHIRVLPVVTYRLHQLRPAAAAIRTRYSNRLWSQGTIEACETSDCLMLDRFVCRQRHNFITSSLAGGVSHRAVCAGHQGWTENAGPENETLNFRAWKCGTTETWPEIGGQAAESEYRM